ncbi:MULTISPECIES: hypothetical protein [Deinococcus]|uniref:hypothetical protein n=1 Tax=Deinococcus TaxID=1298 RepID=UPI00048373C8|nr:MULTISPECIES: hypothetical protein [Deinococcus]KEF33450.1 hypothetical protein RDMS_12280 [Deinococcus sp. RL]
MITWFDALLVTVWAVLTALGARRGLAGLAWGAGGVLACWLANWGGQQAGSWTLGLLLALGLGLALSLGVQRLVLTQVGPPPRWHAGAGAIGGLLLGGTLVAVLTLGFPLGVRVGIQGRTGVYPATDLPAPLYTAVRRSLLREGLMGVWSASPPLRTLLVPDRR